MKAALAILQEIEKSQWYPIIPIWLDIKLKLLKDILKEDISSVDAEHIYLYQIGAPDQFKQFHIVIQEIHKGQLTDPNLESVRVKELKTSLVLELVRKIASSRVASQAYLGGRHHIIIKMHPEWFMFKDQGDKALDIFPELLEQGSILSISLSMQEKE